MVTFTTPINQIEALYVGYFGRAGDPAGVNYWINGQFFFPQPLTLSQIAATFAQQSEARSKYPYLANPNLSDPGQFVDQVYQNLFNHAADPAGKAYWVAQLQAAKGDPIVVGNFILNVISGATGLDAITIGNKVVVAADFTTKAANAGTTWDAKAAAQSSSEISSVDDTSASVDAARAATDAFISSAPGPQQNFTLGLDSLTASTLNANFNAPLVFNPPTGTLIQSLQSGDSAINTAPLTGPGLSNGGLFTGILEGLAPNVILRNIPTHQVTNVGGGIAGYSGTITGLTSLINNNSVGGLTIGALGAGIDAGGIAGTTTTGATLLNSVIANNTASGATTVFVNSAALSGSSDGLRINTTGAFGTSLAPNTISVKNDTAAPGAVMNGYEMIDINAAGATFLRLADATSGIASTTTITVAGAGAISLFGEATEGHFTKLTTIDASTETGGVIVTGANTAGGLLVGNTVLTSFKGGTGADSLDLASMTLPQLGAFTTLAGGDGRDTLALVPGVLNTTTSLVNAGFEILSAGAGLTGTIDYSKLGTGVDTLQITGLAAANTTFNNLPSTFTFDSPAFTNNKSFTFNGPVGLSDTLNVIASNKAGGGGTYTDFTTTGFETVNVTLTGSTNWAVNGTFNASPSAGGTVTLNMIHSMTGGAFMQLNGAFGADTINVFSTDPTIVSGAVNIVGFFDAGALNASGLHPGASSTTVGVVMSSGATNPITILGSVGADTLRGSGGADTINGGPGDDTLAGDAGGDLLMGGAGVDTMGFNSGTTSFAVAGQSVVASGQNLTASIAAGQTLVFNTVSVGNVDRVADFVSGTDKMQVPNANVAPTSLFGGDGTAALNDDEIYVLYGTWVAGTGTFTVAPGYAAGSASDAVVFQGNGALSANTHTGTVVVLGLNQALIAADFI
jgi:hypothetical protein